MLNRKVAQDFYITIIINIMSLMKKNYIRLCNPWASFALRLSHIARYAPSAQDKICSTDCSFSINISY